MKRDSVVLLNYCRILLRIHPDSSSRTSPLSVLLFLLDARRFRDQNIWADPATSTTCSNKVEQLSYEEPEIVEGELEGGREFVRQFSGSSPSVSPDNSKSTSFWPVDSEEGRKELIDCSQWFSYLSELVSLLSSSTASGPELTWSELNASIY